MIRRQVAIILITALALNLAGCVSVTDPNNYRPQTDTISKDFYSCSQQANEPVAGAAWGTNGGYGGAGMKVDPTMLLRCMQAQDYRLRKATGAEWTVGLIFLPITLPIDVLSGGAMTRDVIIGGGNAEP